jgi:4-alpha-glucanotransferase
LIESDEAAAAARAEREREKEALLARLASEGILEGPRAPNDAADLRGAMHEFLCRTPAALVGIALDDLAGETESVNLPGVGPDKHASWTRKMSMTIEEIRESPEVAKALRCADRRGARSAERGAS